MNKRDQQKVGLKIKFFGSSAPRPPGGAYWPFQPPCRCYYESRSANYYALKSGLRREQRRGRWERIKEEMKKNIKKWWLWGINLYWRRWGYRV